MQVRRRHVHDDSAGSDLTSPSPSLLPNLPPSQVRPKTVVVILTTALLFIGALYLFWQLNLIVRWILIAVFLAVALDPAVNWLNRRIPRILAILLIYLALVLLLLGMSALVLPPLIEQARSFIDAIVNLAQQPGGAEQALQQLADRYGLGGYVDALREEVAALPGRLTGAARPLFALVSGIIGSIVAFVSILLITFFLLLDGQRFVDVGLNLMPPARRPQMRRILARSSRAVYGYISGNLVISVIAGVTALLVMGIIHVPFALVLALLVALLDLIPLVGATIGAVIVIIVGFFVSPLTGILLTVYFVIYQQIENNVLQPLVYGRSVHLHPLVIFLAVLIGGQLLGILGALLAIPVAEIIRILIAEWVASRRDATPDTASSPEQETSGEQEVVSGTEPHS
ncbi:MAG TPA: AI-2E family transporter [Ktedonobacterales bacterium]|nr:AI-2E family transporter [Ktedonobacterales bacterium]